MPTGTLAFTLPEEQDLFDIASKAGQLHSTLSDLREYLRSQRKYTDLKPAAREAYDEMWERFHGILSENTVDHLFV